MHMEMQVCAMRRYNVTNPSLQTDLVNSVEVFLYNSYTIAFPNTAESNDCMYCVSSARSKARVIYHIQKVLYSLA